MSEDLTRERNKNSIQEERIDALSHTITEQTEENESLGSTLQKLKDESEKAKKANASINGRNLVLSNRLKELEERIASLEPLQSELLGKESEILKLKADYSELQSELDKIQDLLNKANRTIDREKAEEMVLSDKCKELQDSQQTLSEQIDTLNSLLEKIKKECSLYKEESLESKEKLDELTKEKAGLEDRISALDKEIDFQKAENDSLRQQLENLKTEMEELSPYMYLIEAKKEQEAIELAIREAREKLTNSIDTALNLLSSLQHEDIKRPLETTIESSRNLVNSDDCSLEELNASIIKLQSETQSADSQEKQFLEEEERQRKEEEERQRKEEEERQRKEEEERQRKEEEERQRKEEEERQRKEEEERQRKEEEERQRKEEEERQRKEEEERQRKEEEEAEESSSNMDDDDSLEEDNLPYIYDYGLIPAEKLSIPEVYDVKEAKIVNSRDFFAQNESELILWRRNLQEEYLMGHARFICPECKQPVKISGHKLQRGRVCYFAHFKDSDDCPYKTGTNKTKEEIERQKYSLVQESERHKRLKAAIASALRGEKSKELGVRNVECEKRISSDIPYLNWRRPDVYAECNGRKYVFELQLSTTFVSVIVDRDIFYRLNNYNIIWIFNFEDNAEYVNLHNLMCKDIYYANKRNVFIFDDEAEEKSKEKGELVLKCRWLDENGDWSKDEFVTLDMFQYDEENNKPFIVDADKAYLEKYPEYVERRKQLEHSREYLLKSLMERQKQEEEIEKRKKEERSNLQLELLKNEKCVERFRSGTKYGYQYGGTIILPAKYTSAEDIREDGYAQVGFNRKIGLVRKDGKEIVPVEYKNIDIINNRHGIVMASYKRIDLWLGDRRFSLCNEFDDKEQKVLKEEEIKKTKYILQTSTYEYYYTSSRYGDYPKRHKGFAEYKKSTLFSIVEKKDGCIILDSNRTYWLSKNRLSEIDGSFTDIRSIGVDQIFIAKQSNTNLWGVIDLQGNIITDFKYVDLIPTDSEYLIVKYINDAKFYGVIDYQGREFIEPKYEALFYLNSGRFAFRNNRLWGVCDWMGNVLHPAEYTYIRVLSSGSLAASTLDSFSVKWKVNDNIPSYNEEDVKLCLLNEKGDIAFAEQVVEQYYIRHSGDMYSILSSDSRELVSYLLSYVEFVNKSTAIIKDSEGNAGIFVDEKCHFFYKCENIELLSEGTFKFENEMGNYALGNCSGPISDYSYSEIKTIDSSHFVVSQKSQSRWGYSSSLNYFILDKNGEVLSEAFSQIDEFEDGLANAVYQGRKGVIDVAGNMQEIVVGIYGDYTLYVKFEDYYFRNKETGVVGEKYQNVVHLVDMFFAVKMRWGTTVRLYSLETNKTSEDSFDAVTHLDGDFFVVKIHESSDGSYYSSQSSNVYQLYKGLEQFSSERYCSITLLSNGYIGLQKAIGWGYSPKKTWKISRNDGTILSDKEYDSIIEANKDSFKVSIGGSEGLVDLNGCAIVEKVTVEKGYVLTHCFADYGLEDADGNVLISLEKHFSSIEFIEGELIKVCLNHKYALYTAAGVQITEPKFLSITYESADRYAVIEENIKGHIDSKGNYIESSTVFISEDNVTIFVVMEKYGLKDSNANIIIPAEFSSIDYLTGGKLAVKRGIKVALFNTDGKQLTEFKYSDIILSDDGSIQATRNKTFGGLDDEGNEIADEKHFKGGCLKILFGDYYVTNDSDEIIIPVGYSRIELLDNEGVLALWNKNMVAIWNSKDKTEPIYESVKSIGNGFFVVSRTISKKVRVRQTGRSYRGNRYTYYTTHTVDEMKYGIIDRALRTIIPCKYYSISDFDVENNITATDSKKEKKSISLQYLNKMASHTKELSKGTEYNVRVQSFMPIGLIVKIQGGSFVIHRKYLFKEKKEFKKKESFVAKYLGNDQNGHPIWETRSNQSENPE